MPKLVQILYVKSDKANPQPRVRYVGGMNPDGSRWNLSEDAAIAGMKEGKWRFWTAGGKKSVWVVTAKSASGREYLKAETDWVQPATLLALPDYQ
jgi:Protein of unknown function (DUF3892)